MSLVEHLGARIRATSDNLPLGLVTMAVERLRTATELLIWVRQASTNPLAVPSLAHAAEHAEQAGHALRVAQQALADYLAAIGLGAALPSAPDRSWRTALDQTDRTGPGAPAASAAPALGRWWATRVAELTGHEPEPDQPAGSTSGRDTDGPGRSDGPGGPPARSGAADSVELLRRVAGAVRAGDRDRLHRDLAAVAPPTGLELAAITPPVLHRLASDLLDHHPRDEDLRRLDAATGPWVRKLLPGLPAPVLGTRLARICRIAPEPRRTGDDRPPPAHPADSAIAAAVLTGVLLRLLDREPQSLDPGAPEPLDRGRGRDA